jgi:hypothetical protein
VADYGTDITGLGDITSSLSEVEGRRALIESIGRRLITPRGALFYDDSYGFDLRQYLSGVFPGAGPIAAGVLEQVEADERVLSADADVRLVGQTLTIQTSITDGGGPFDLTLAINQVTSTILLDGVAL